MPVFDLLVSLFSQVLYFTGFINESNAFPPALTPDEEKMYLERLKQGDPEARRILIEHNLRLVAHIAKKYSGEKSPEDLISIGTIGLIKGVNTFDTEKNARLSSYIARCIEAIQV